MARRKSAPLHPGEILALEFLEPLRLSRPRVARDISVPARRIHEIVRGKRGITADTALRLARYFETTEHFWLNLQTHYDLEVARDRLGDRLRKDVQVLRRTG
jgi:addiction module HigA family antidote